MGDNIITVYKNECFSIDIYKEFINCITFSGIFSKDSKSCLNDFYKAVDICLEKKEKFALIFDTRNIKSMPPIDLIAGLLNKIKKHSDELDKYLICTCILVNSFGKVLMNFVFCMYTPKLPFIVEKELEVGLKFIFNTKNSEA